MSNTYQATIEEIGKTLLEAADIGQAVGSFAESHPELDATMAYDVQEFVLKMRLDRGEKIVGIKLGVTSKAKQRQVNVDTPGVAWLTDAMMMDPFGAVPLSKMIHPRVEPEIGFVLDKPLKGPGISAAKAMTAVKHVVGALEIIDSRFSGFSFTLPDVIADNNSSGYFVTGSVPLEPHELDTSVEATLLEVDGEIVETATGAAVYGHPAEALAFAANLFGERGHTLEEGWLVLTGGMTDAHPLKSGMRIASHFTNLGSLTITGGK